MNKLNSVSLSASVFSALAATTIVGLGFVAVIPSPAEARSRDVVVTAQRENPDTITRKVHYGDLNLASLPGEKMLQRRVGRAVNGICEEITGPNPTLIVHLNCRSEAWGSARPQVRQAVQRAREIAMTGTSTIAATAITITFK